MGAVLAAVDSRHAGTRRRPAILHQVARRVMTGRYLSRDFLPLVDLGALHLVVDTVLLMILRHHLALVASVLEVGPDLGP